jgi:7-cyano-7-deazaguanine synthase
MTAATVVCFSGGIDSTVLLCSELSLGRTVHAVSVNYGQRHVCELESAQAITARLGVHWVRVDLPQLRDVMFGSSQTDDAVAVPDGHYSDDVMRITVVPNRNMILLSIATALAVSIGAEAVAYAAHAGDHAIYPDCREPFADAMAKAIALADWVPVYLRRPFLSVTKADIVKLGAALGAPLNLTWSCYKGGNIHCGRCGTCVERREAFTLARVVDPTTYAEANDVHD